MAAPPNIQPMRRPVCRSDGTLVLASRSARLFHPRIEWAALLASSIRPATIPRISRARFIARAPWRTSVGSGTPASWKASRRSRHLLHWPQWAPLWGFMHESVSSRGTPRLTPSRMTSLLCIVENGVTTSRSWARPSESARAIAAKNSGVASGNGLPASGPSARRPMRCCAQ